MASYDLKLIVFDLDYTLWPFWLDSQVSPPFQKLWNGSIVDTRKKKIKFYPEVPSVLQKLHNKGYTLAVASRTSQIISARQLLDLFGWDKYFKYKQIFPDCKVTHFKKLKEESGFDYKQMIFFDDEERNIRDVNDIGVISILVSNGVTKKIVKEGISKYLNKK